MAYSVTPKRKVGCSSHLGNAKNPAESPVKSRFSAFLIFPEGFSLIRLFLPSYPAVNFFLIVALTEIPANQISRIFSFLASFRICVRKSTWSTTAL